ncbi:decarboxylating NADP(+)-dependent phosphogluconate dehydrogenase [Algibacter amylolyticus]|uniref:6-phosphogluconate dehydrogenase, decarboxylating n=1 Tax=Algibacter amylolyticus TaxID=1608400 RepID=A0A5M7BCI1_9FLAO|nr:decarboxylating NADP(+)-dependent phosphogluconate dehydrogenase [Algibacter amylolyticus]KAA5825164.1 decarboxylating NADP(+)-dependent phosphogluconate dehydrogenase [Algibacter amylolyticus]MBB5268723.1 6-phosphogluconate dehydrogenase [Algibacter amylolyticus]TSJ77658.1 decarboxylating NADP(+)-dependent phosphogluconate dehydrogenase [Algibacter amylolyticus]
MNSNKVIYIMGVSGCGKSTIGQMLAKRFKIPFFDGDDFHPQSNIDKMSSGLPLNDADRLGWLQTLNELAKTELQKSSCVIVCSALKESYRTLLSKGVEDQTAWVHLVGSYNQIVERLNKRENHFMDSSLLQSQFDTLENPSNALEINIGLTPEEIVDKITKDIKMKSEFGLFGLGVMGKSLSRNLAQKGFNISVFNREVKGTEEDVAIHFKNSHKELDSAQAFSDIQGFVNSLQTPRRIMLMVNAGKITDYVIEDLIPFLSEGDILIDGGNSNYIKTKERYDYLKSKNIHFIGVGVSGGEQGALKGPSIMPGGNKEIYNLVKPYLESIAAKDDNNLPCCTYIGEEGSGHFVKMVHNGIEYVEMQLLAEVFTILKTMGKTPDEVADILESWKPKADSYLLGITVDILRKKDGNDWLINKIVDKAGNKGTGNWTTIAAAQLGAPSTLIASALFARYTSFYKDERLQASINLNINPSILNLEIEDVCNAYQFARIINHYQGLKLISEAGKSYGWHLNLSEIARIWTNGCIIKSDFMVELIPVLKEDDNILKNKLIINRVKALKPSINKVVSECVLKELTAPCLSESVNFLNAYATANSSANIIQAQRDYFGAHTYQRTDDNSGKFHHTNWN